ncbi:hypothetical protein MMOR_13820 [Mycolicibacterium moriokaense]|uniref:Uncharacterized protein n=1 Tax=Mycolicibacterium moriokaense TaxID=39691 RepID=A0AAD1H942_9MYCO|nr:hypothetical protein MMOR_13820 [Mycolicibacterium moriokaense]
MITAVVTQAAKRGPRTSTWSGGVLVVLLVLVVVDIHVLLLHGWTGWDGRADHMGPLPSAARRKARLLSSYSNNNSNNPRRGTDQLRGAW